ncbi:hypothetical protein EMIHUDRAFT_444167 [Emiliania huxleyi CCMP1516]|uniref:Uncharacterized protein n=2 Tax=Emiliania huxleyi TaxID=2903 RepID=A0A0D3JIJ6_EMIH1|nr:hypothetical protein EMIHUDRAFT_444167 [Emiliania huxleyi CCMP1516]EOD23331.1 hypothetical protein EMIHUDRAFT_444167 [Emiliania huxleyi CCMP1516]|eukprot:XP_005775760.1 hypothetical protein EMIHUDRAFT_444167 [Emiliania huxleyi CCMP1516]
MNVRAVYRPVHLWRHLRTQHSSSWIYGGIDARGSTNCRWAEEIAAEVSAVDMVGWVLRERSFSSQLGIELCQPTHCDGWQSLTRLMVG